MQIDGEPAQVEQADRVLRSFGRWAAQKQRDRGKRPTVLAQHGGETPSAIPALVAAHPTIAVRPSDGQARYVESRR